MIMNKTDCATCGKPAGPDHDCNYQSSAPPTGSMAEAESLGDDLMMMANQLREHLADKRNHAPATWRFDDWLNRYRSWYEGH